MVECSSNIPQTESKIIQLKAFIFLHNQYFENFEKIKIIIHSIY